MKKITSTTGQTIRFALRGDAVFLFSPTEAVEVSDSDAALLKERLGAQLAVEDAPLEEKKVEVAAQVAAPAPEVATAPADAQVTAPPAGQVAASDTEAGASSAAAE